MQQEGVIAGVAKEKGRRNKLRKKTMNIDIVFIRRSTLSGQVCRSSECVGNGETSENENGKNTQREGERDVDHR